MRRFPPAPRRAAGFSLIELLIVIAILSILITVMVPAINSTLRSMNLSAASQTVVDQLNYARQTAISRQIPVEVRFYKLPEYDGDPAGALAVYRAVQCFAYDDTNVVPLNRLQLFPNPVVVSSNADQSALFDGTVATELAGTNALPSYGANYRYRSVYFRPSGSMTSLSSDTNGASVFLTLVLEHDKPLSQGANFATVQVDATTGRATTFRP